MPGGDGTGPVGMGPMTGRGAGYCAGYPTPGYMGPVGGRGCWGRGRGGGRGRRNWYCATGLPFWARAAQGFFGAPAPEQEREALRQQSQQLHESLNAINRDRVLAPAAAASQQLHESLNAINRRIEDLEKEKSR